jgi:hypothetical protein
MKRRHGMIIMSVVLMFAMVLPVFAGGGREAGDGPSGELVVYTSNQTGLVDLVEYTDVAEPLFR